MEKEKNSFLITCVSCIIVLLLICYFGINSSFTKGTFALKSCPTGKFLVGDGEFCCPNTTDVIKTEGSKTYCVNPGRADSDIITLHSSTSTSSGVVCLISGVVSDYSLENIDYACSSKFGESWVASGTPVYNANGQIVVNCSSQCAVLATDATLNEELEISYSVNGVKTDVVPVYKDEIYTIEEPRQSVIPSNCSFITWYALTADNDRKEYKPGDKYTVTGNLELHADYNCMVDVVANAGNGTITKVDGVNNLTPNLKDYTQSCIIGYNKSKCSIGGNVEASLDGYTFNGWGEQGCTSGKPITQYEVSQNTTFYACYTKNETTTPTTKTFNATFKDYDGSELSRTSCTTNATNTYCQVSAPATNPSRTGYTFNGWSWGGNDCSRIWHSTMTISGDISFYACYTENSNTVDPEPEKPEIDDQKPETNVDENPQTGSIVIFIVWVIGLAAIVYSVWYFRKLRKN